MEGSAFSRLSGELRNSIYGLLLPEPGEIPLWVSGPPNKRAAAGVTEPVRAWLALTGFGSTCKAIRIEILTLYAASNVLRILVDRVPLHNTLGYKSSISSLRLPEWSCKAGQSIRLHFKCIVIDLGKTFNESFDRDADFNWHDLLRPLKETVQPDTGISVCFVVDPQKYGIALPCFQVSLDLDRRQNSKETWRPMDWTFVKRSAEKSQTLKVPQRLVEDVQSFLQMIPDAGRERVLSLPERRQNNRLETLDQHEPFTHSIMPSSTWSLSDVDG
ncbi:hypothetical protein PRZ48_003347 [Zasmidium cellare]|uniref:Uncharacterized protein n=1 Tax=Zasmidium cellare TaxID=395010 RepID=A0ABR0EUT1_ZASCE|nr:hypothetical protein PRZ48_003347 [Zasmidium cellare]